MQAISKATGAATDGVAPRLGVGAAGAAGAARGAAVLPEVPDFGSALTGKLGPNWIGAESPVDAPARPVPAPPTARAAAGAKPESLPLPAVKTRRKEPEDMLVSPSPVLLAPPATSSRPVEAGNPAVLAQRAGNSDQIGGFEASKPTSGTGNGLDTVSASPIPAPVFGQPTGPASERTSIGLADSRAQPEASAGTTPPAGDGRSVFKVGAADGLEMAALDARDSKLIDAGPAGASAPAATRAAAPEAAPPITQPTQNPVQVDPRDGQNLTSAFPDHIPFLAEVAAEAARPSKVAVLDGVELTGRAVRVATPSLAPGGAVSAGQQGFADAADHPLEALSFSPGLTATAPTERGAAAGGKAEKTWPAMAGSAQPGGSSPPDLAARGEGPASAVAGGAVEGQGAGVVTGLPAAGASDSFRRIDTAAAAPRALRPASSVVEVGIDDPAHGWLAVRAEGASGQVHASLSAASPEAQSALRAQLAGMADYLAERAIEVRSLAVGHGPGEGAGSLSPRSGGDTPGGQGREFAGNSDANPNGGHHREGSPSAVAASTDLSIGNHFSDGRSPYEPTAAGEWQAQPVSRAVGRAAGYYDPPHALNVLA